VLAGRQFCDGFEFSVEAVEEFLGGVGHGAATGRARAQTCAQRRVIADRLDEAEQTPVSDRKLSGAQAELTISEGRIQDDPETRAQNHVGAPKQLLVGLTRKRFGIGIHRACCVGGTPARAFRVRSESMTGTLRDRPRY